MDQQELVSIVVLTHNALGNCKLLFDSLTTTREVTYELVVVDNASTTETRDYLWSEFSRERINRICFLDRNTFFAEGNNIGISASSRTSSHVLLLNSDVEIRSPFWLRKLLDVHRTGATTYGFVPDMPWPRADGYCFLIDRWLCLRYGLDERFQWFWCVTKLQAELLRDGFAVQAVRNHSRFLFHFGGRSGDAPYRSAAGMDLDEAVVARWFDGRNVSIIASLE